MDGKVAESSDVYSFGAIFLMLLTGKIPYFSDLTGERNDQNSALIIWAGNGFKNNCIYEIVDPSITRNGLTSIEDLQLRQSIHLALRCVAEGGDDRPTMVEVATNLNNTTRCPQSIPTT